MLAYLKLLYYLLRPRTKFVRRISNALGDNLLLSALLPAIREKWPGYKIIVETPKPEIFWNNPHVDWVTIKHIKTTKHHIKPKYRIFNGSEPHFIAQMRAYIGLKGTSPPQLFLTPDEIRSIQKRFEFPYIAISPVGKTSFSANRKEWGFENFKKLIRLFKDYRFIQIGLPKDPLLPNAVDARGFLIRETAAVIFNATLFIGLEGGLMHLAKAIGTPSAIIYGGYIRPETSGYSDNLNIYTATCCSPCHRSEKALPECPMMICMQPIHPEDVSEQIRQYLSLTVS